MEVKKNKESLSKLKTENKDLRSQLSSLMSDQGRNASSSEMSKLEKQVSDLRRNHDDVKHKLLMRQKEVSAPLSMVEHCACDAACPSRPRLRPHPLDETAQANARHTGSGGG